MEKITDQIAKGLTKSLPGLPLSVRRRLSVGRRVAFDVRQAAQGAFMREPPSRPARLAHELSALRKSLKSNPTDVRELKMEFWPHIGIEDQEQHDRLLGETNRLLRVLDKAIKSVKSHVETRLDRKGGRRRDERVDRFVMSLAQIYRRQTGERPTTITDPQSGALSSPFDLFVLEAFRHFYPEDPVPQGSVQTAIRQVVEFERGTEAGGPTPEDYPS